jgi:hypothetical protein
VFGLGALDNHAQRLKPIIPIPATPEAAPAPIISTEAMPDRKAIRTKKARKLLNHGFINYSCYQFTFTLYYTTPGTSYAYIQQF